MLLLPKKTQTTETYTVTISSQESSYYRSTTTTTTTTTIDAPVSSDAPDEVSDPPKRRKYNYQTRGCLRTHHINRLNQAVDLKAIVMEYSIDPYEYDDEILIDCTVMMYEYYELFAAFTFTRDAVKQFMSSIRELYNPDNDFHNFKHAWSVMHNCFHVLIRGADQFLGKLDILAVFIASICHDVRHPGNSNAFEHATESSISRNYSRPNEVCVLERYHAAVAESVLSAHWCKDILLNNISSVNRQVLMKQINYIIMGTDMTKHKDLVGEVDEVSSELANYLDLSQMNEAIEENRARNYLHMGAVPEEGVGAGGVRVVSPSAKRKAPSMGMGSGSGTPKTSKDEVKKVHIRILQENEEEEEATIKETTTTTTTTLHGGQQVTSTTSTTSSTTKGGGGGMASVQDEMNNRKLFQEVGCSRDENEEDCEDSGGIPGELRDKLTRIIVHVADIGAQTTVQAVAYKWTFRCYAEFKHQAAVEKVMGIVTSPFLHDLNNDRKIFTSQLSFIQDIVEPIWANIVRMLPALSFAMTNLRTNKEQYQQFITAAATATAATATVTATAATNTTSSTSSSSSAAAADSSSSSTSSSKR